MVCKKPLIIVGKGLINGLVLFAIIGSIILGMLYKVKKNEIYFVYMHI